MQEVKAGSPFKADKLDLFFLINKCPCSHNHHLNKWLKLKHNVPQIQSELASSFWTAVQPIKH